MQPAVKKTKSVLSKLKNLNFLRLFGKYYWNITGLLIFKSNAPIFFLSEEVIKVIECTSRNDLIVLVRKEKYKKISDQ